MIALWIVGGIVLFLSALLALPLHLIITYRETVTVRARVLFFPITLYPRKPKGPRASAAAERKKQKKAEKRAKRGKKKSPKPTEPSPPKEKQKRTLQENLALVRGIVAALFRKTGKHLRLKATRIHLRVATGDAATTALAYGAASASLSFLLAALDRVTKLRARPGDVLVVADYLSERPSADIKLVFTLRIWGALSTAFSAAMAFLKHRTAGKPSKQKASQRNEDRL